MIGGDFFLVRKQDLCCMGCVLYYEAHSHLKWHLQKKIHLIFFITVRVKIIKQLQLIKLKPYEKLGEFSALYIDIFVCLTNSSVCENLSSNVLLSLVEKRKKEKNRMFICRCDMQVYCIFHILIKIIKVPLNVVAINAFFAQPLRQDQGCQ